MCTPLAATTSGRWQWQPFVSQTKCTGVHQLLAARLWYVVVGHSFAGTYQEQLSLTKGNVSEFWPEPIMCCVSRLWQCNSKAGISWRGVAISEMPFESICRRCGSDLRLTFCKTPHTARATDYGTLYSNHMRTKMIPF